MGQTQTNGQGIGLQDIQDAQKAFSNSGLNNIQAAPKATQYNQKTNLTPEQQTLLNQLLSQSNPNYGLAAEGYRQFLPGGGGGEAITAQANKNFQQQTLPSILNAFGSGSKGSSALNQALAAGAANLNTDLASQLAQLQLQAAGGLSGIAGQQAGLGLGTPAFSYLEEQMQEPLWKRIARPAASIGGATLGGVGGFFAGGPAGALAGANLGYQAGNALSKAI